MCSLMLLYGRHQDYNMLPCLTSGWLLGFMQGSLGEQGGDQATNSFKGIKSWMKKPAFW